MRFSELSSRYQRTILVLKKKASQDTIASHLRFFNAALPDAMLESLDCVMLQAVLTEASKTRTPKTTRNMWSSLRLVLKQAKREGLIASIPEIELPRCYRHAQARFTLEQMQSLVKSSEGLDRVLYGLLAESGLRIGEALALRFTDIDFHNKTLTVRRSLYAGEMQEPKTESSLRTLCISLRLRTLLAAPGDGLIFPIPSRTASARLYSLERKLGIEPAGFHAFRRGNISVLENKILMPYAIIRYRVGHAPTDMTGRYNSPELFADRPWADKIGRLVIPKL